jgi:hypothetical protein
MEFYEKIRQERLENIINVTNSVRDDIVGIDDRQLASIIEKSDHVRRISDDEDIKHINPTDPRSDSQI